MMQVASRVILNEDLALTYHGQADTVHSVIDSIAFVQVDTEQKDTMIVTLRYPCTTKRLPSGGIAFIRSEPV